MATGMYVIRGRRSVKGFAAMFALACGFVLLMASGARAVLTWSGPTGQDSGGQGSAIVALACPPAGTCVAVDQAGAEMTFDSGNPRYVTPVSIDSQPPTGLACPSSSECVALDGGGNRVTFNPASPSSASTVTIDSGQSFTGLSCVPGTSTCVGVDATGNEVTFDPSPPPGAPAPQPIPLEAGLKLLGVSCVTQTLCAAIDSADKEITFNPAAPQTDNIPETLESGSASLTAITCPSSTQCLAFDNTGQKISTNPQAPTVAPVSTPIDGPGNGILAATCPSSTQCVALDNAGNAVTFAPGQSQPGALRLIDPDKDLAGIACPSGCVAGDATGHVYGFSPAGSGVTTTLIDARTAYSAVACPATSQCTAMDNFGDEATFNPGSLSAAAASVDPTANIVYDIACPSATQCTAVDDLGQAATFDPLSPGNAKATAIVKGHPLLAVSCPAISQCTAVDDDRYAVTFDPRNPTTGAYTNLGTPAGANLVGVACPSARQCTALDGVGDAVTFNPQAPGTPSPTPVLGAPGVAIACPSTAECIALDSNGNRATFDPQAPATVATSPVSSGQPTSLSCSSATYCVGLDTNGRTFEFDPHGVGATTSASVGDSAQISDLTCPAVTLCVAVDYAGAAFIGSQTVAGVPSALKGPSIAGRLIAGDVVTAKPGAWLNAPTSFSPKWERCKASGRSCLPIVGATNQTYQLAKPDIGHTLRVIETATNQLGASAPSTSRPTRAVAGRPAGPIVSRAQLSAPKGGQPRLILKLAAARYGPLLRTVTVRLPAGLSVAAGGPVSAVALTVSGRKVRGSLRRESGGFAVTLPRATSSLRLALAGPRLLITGTLATRVRRRRAKRLSVTISLGSSRTLRTVAPMAVNG